MLCMSTASLLFTQTYGTHSVDLGVRTLDTATGRRSGSWSDLSNNKRGCKCVGTQAKSKHAHVYAFEQQQLNTWKCLWYLKVFYSFDGGHEAPLNELQVRHHAAVVPTTYEEIGGNQLIAYQYTYAFRR